MKILTSIIIPVFNEEKTIKILLDKVLEQKNIEKEIIVIDDCSTDKTKHLIETEYKNKVKFISNYKNFGKGYCVRKGIEISNGEIILIQDAINNINTHSV